MLATRFDLIETQMAKRHEKHQQLVAKKFKEAEERAERRFTGKISEDAREQAIAQDLNL